MLIRRTISCTPTEWARLQERARGAGTTVSRLLVETALRDRLGPRLAWSEAEQRQLLEDVARVRAAYETLLRPLRGTGVTLREAIAFLYHKRRRELADLHEIEGTRP